MRPSNRRSEYQDAIKLPDPRLPPRRVYDYLKFQEDRRAPHILAGVPIYPGVNPSPHLVWNSLADFVNYVRKIPGKQPTWYLTHDYNWLEAENRRHPQNRTWLKTVDYSDQTCNFNRTDDPRIYQHESAWGTNSIDEMIAVYDKGWSAGFALVKETFENASMAAISAIENDDSLLKDFHGSVVDVPTFLSGDPECMYEFREEAKEVMKLEVDLDYFYGGSLREQEYLFRGATVMAAVMALRRLGVFVTLYAKEVSTACTWASGWKRKPHSCTIHLMNPGIPENISEVLLAVAHPHFNCPLFYEAQCMGWGNAPTYGICSQNRSEDDFFPKAGSGKICVPGLWSRDAFVSLELEQSGIEWSEFWSSPESAATMVKVMLQSAAPVSR